MFRLVLKGLVRTTSSILLVGINLAAALVIISGGTVAYFLWKVSSTSQSLNTITPWLIQELNDTTQGFNIGIGDANLIRNSDGLFAIQMLDVVVREKKTDSLIVSVPSAEVSFSVTDLLKGQIAISNFKLVGASVRIVRDESGEYLIGLSGNSVAVNELARWTVGKTEYEGGDSLLKADSSELTIGLSKAILVFDDRKLQRVLTGQIASAEVNTINSEEDGFSLLDGNAQVNLATSAGNIAINFGLEPLNDANNNLVVSADTSDISIAQLSEILGTSPPKKFQDLKISTQARYVIDGDGSIPVFAIRSISDNADLDFLHAYYPGINLESAIFEATGDDFDKLDVGKLQLNTNAGIFNFSGQVSRYFSTPPNSFNSTASQENHPVVNNATLEKDDVQNTQVKQSSGFDLVGKMVFQPFTESPLKPTEDEVIFNLRLLTAPENMGNDADNGTENESNNINVQSEEENLFEKLLIRAVSWRRGEGSWTVVGELDLEEGNNSLNLKGRVNNFNLPHLYRPWPTNIAPQTLKWMKGNLFSCFITDGTISISLDNDELNGDSNLADESFNLTFNYNNLDLNYLDGMPDIIDATGQAILSGNKFVAKAKTAKIVTKLERVIELEDSVFTVNELQVEEHFGSFQSKVKSRLISIMRLIDMPALDLLADSRIKPNQFGGNLKMDLDLYFPLSKESSAEIVSNVSANVTDTIINKVYEDFNISEGNFDVVINSYGINGSGNAKVNGSPMLISWQKPFEEFEGRQIENYHIKARLDNEERETFGLNLLPGAIDGFVGLDFQATILDGKLNHQVLRFDATETEINIRPILFNKPAGVPASGVTVIRHVNEDTANIENFYASSDDFSVSGFGELDLRTGKVNSLNFRDASWIGNKVSGEIVRREDDVFDVFVLGEKIDARPFLADIGIGEFVLAKEDEKLAKFISDRQAEDKAKKDAEKSSSKDEGTLSWRVFLTVDRIFGFNDVFISNVTGGIRFNDNELYNASLRGSFSDGKGIGIVLKEGGASQNSRQRMLINSESGGNVLRGLGYYEKITGGNLEIDFSLRNENYNTLDGILSVKNFSIVGEKNIEKLMRQAKQPNANPNSDSRDKGIIFAELVAPFSISEEQAYIEGLRINNQSVGVTLSGLLNRKDDTVEFSGTFTPLYALNTFVGQIPIIGDIFTGGNEGEGIFGIVFTLKGSIENPQLTINPVSALTPGIFRRIFGGGAPEKTNP